MLTRQIGDLNLSGVDEFGVAWEVEKVVGWGTTASTTSQQQKPRQSGAWSGDAYAKGRDVAVNGTLVAPDTAAASAALDRLYAAVSLDDTPLIIADGGDPRWCMAHRVDQVVPVWLNGVAVQWSFQVASDDWRKFGSELTGSTGLPSSTGGLTVPFTVPFAINAVNVSGQVNLTNPGNTAGPVRLRIDGPCTGPIVTHVASGASLVFSSSLTLNAGEWLDVDMEARTVLANGQASRSAWVTSRGWSEFEVGDNTFAFTAASYSSGAKLTVYATPSWQ